MKPDVLLWDDDPDFTAELAKALGARGFATRVVSSIAEISVTREPTVLLLDLCMPGQDGVETLMLLSGHAQKDLLKIMFVSGWDETMVSAATRLGAARGLRLLPASRKPIAIRELCDKLDAAG